MIKNWIYLGLFSIGVIWTVIKLFRKKNVTDDSKQIDPSYKVYDIFALAIFIYLVITYINKIFF